MIQECTSVLLNQGYMKTVLVQWHATQIRMHGLLQEAPEKHLPLSILSFQNFYGGICLYLAQISVKLICPLSFVCYHCLEYVR